MTNQLIALLDGREVGTVTHKSGRLSFTYSESWLSNPNAYPLSLSMPLGSITHGHKRIEPFLWGLLPDNERVLQSWGREFHVSPRNVFRLIEHVGEDCAGAVQFVSRERLEAMVGETVAQEIAWISQNDIAKRLAALRADHSAWRVETDAGRFSLAGAQPKTALLFDGKRWGVPSGRTPTTHILKPPTGDFEGHAENEHFSLQLARSLGIIVPNSKVLHFGDEIAIVVERYDRVRDGALWSRIHQEDMCQALGLHPTSKYESDGGPGIAKIVELIREHSSEPTEDVEAFTDAMAFNWLIAGTDAHAKNYSLLIGSGAGVRLAPIYDLASILPYRAPSLLRVKLAMKIGGEYRLSNIGFLPIYPAWNSYTSEMIGDHSAVAMIDAYRKGLRGFDIQDAYRLMRQSALSIPADNARYLDGEGRRALGSYMKYGYIPLEDPVRAAFHQNEQVSRTLEYAYDDAMIGRQAAELGNAEDAELFRKRGQNWRNVIDPVTGFARGRHADGTWLTPFDPTKQPTWLTEAIPWQYTFFVPQDVPGLIRLEGGNAAFVDKLDKLFAGGYYDHGNEPSHHIAYLYDAAGASGKTQKHVHALMESQYHDTPGGLAGNDDAGQMSAWYILSALGFYQVCPGVPEYWLGSPRFDEADIHLPNGHTLKIEARGAKAGKIYVKRVLLNGRALSGYTLQHSDIAAGGTLQFEMVSPP